MISKDRSFLKQALQKDDAILWVDLTDPTQEETAMLFEDFRFHPLAVGDSMAQRKHPKIDDFGEYIFLVLHGPNASTSASSEDFSTTVVDVFLSRRFLVTVHQEPLMFITSTMDVVTKNEKLLKRGPAYVLHAIMDKMIDLYISCMDLMEDEITRLEHDVLSEGAMKNLTRIIEIKRSLHRIARINSRQKNIILKMSRGDIALVPENLQKYFRDIHDHMERIMDLADQFRDLLTGARQSQIVVSSSRAAEMLRVLTVIIAVFLPLFFMAFIWLLLVSWNVDLGWKIAWPVLAFLAVVFGILYIYLFKKKKWL